jgi:hypothetical protein
MRLSSLKGAHSGLSSAAWQEIRYALSKNIPRNGPRNCRSLGYARDDKGEGNASMKSGCWTDVVFHHLGWAERPMIPPVGMTIHFF